MEDIGTVQDTGAAPTAAATPAAATFAAPAAQPATPAAPATQPISGTGEDRSTWVPPYRLRETREQAAREAQQQWAAKEAEYQARLNQVTGQIQRLVGVTPPENPEIDAVKGQFKQLYPGLDALEARAQDLLGIIDRAGDLESVTQHHWQEYGRNAMTRLFEHAQTSLGSALTQEGKETLHQAFVGYVSASPERTARYANDPSIVDEFWQRLTSGFIDPARRVASATVDTRTAQMLPRDTSSGIPGVPAPPKPDNLDDRANLGWAQYQSTAKR
jgi:hypothetical protein